MKRDCPSRTPSRRSAAVQPGVYQRFDGRDYAVLCLGHDSETQAQVVVYQALDGDCEVLVCSLADFQASVERDGLERPRFRRARRPGQSRAS